MQRKLEDAIHSLDDAISPTPEAVDDPRPTKRPAMMRSSLYSTLAKYGIKPRALDSTSTLPASKPADLSMAPHLAAILSRTAARTRNAIPVRFRGMTPRSVSPGGPSSEYRPSSTASFLARLSTFKLNTYSNKPHPINAVAASKCGWINDGKDRLVCGICNASWVLAGREGMSRDAANALVEKQRVQLVDMHKDGCPWKTRQCDPDVYRINFSSPAGMAKEIKARAQTLEPVLDDIEVRHPLTAKEVHSLMTTIGSVKLDSPPPSEATGLLPMAALTQSLEPSQTAVLTALFGWSLAPPAPGPAPPRTPTLSRVSSRAGSVAPSMPATPRAPSRLGGTPAPSTPRHTLSRVSSHLQRSPTGSIFSELKRDAALLHCSLCHRRIGLWAVGSSASRTGGPISAESSSVSVPSGRQIDLLKEHRPYCPYVERTAHVPSLPVPTPPSNSSTLSLHHSNGSNTTLNGQSGAMEGWRAVLTVVLRYRLGQRQRDGLLREVTERIESAREGNSSPTLARSATRAEGDGDQMEVDAVEAMVAGVKNKGGKDLLKYVKGLLG
ncbi:zf-C3HC-domain-containing protein [Dentipellis sp. KUC8613]|nr:zf-C3HC-domain-containing protein [Dentipellis sp. KUC8613]